MIKKTATKRFSGTLPEGVFNKLRELADLRQRSMNTIFQLAVKEYVEKFLDNEKDTIIKG